MVEAGVMNRRNAARKDEVCDSTRLALIAPGRSVMVGMKSPLLIVIQPKYPYHRLFSVFLIENYCSFYT